MDISFIIVNYNTTSWVKQCIESIRENTLQLTFEIILVDNASPNRDIEALVKLIQAEDFIFLPLTQNKGFGAGNNAAISIAKGKYLFLLNPDARLHSDAAGYFFSYMEDEKNGMVCTCGADIRDENNIPTQAYGNFPSLINALAALGFRIFFPTHYKNNMSLGAANYSVENKEVDYISGAAMFIRKTVVDKFGLFDEDFFLFFEETEWAFRMRKAGYKLMLLPEVQIIHSEGASDEKQDAFSIKRYKQFQISKQIFYKKTKGRLFATCIKPIDMIIMWVYTIMGREKGNLFNKSIILWQA